MHSLTKDTWPIVWACVLEVDRHTPDDNSNDTCHTSPTGADSLLFCKYCTYEMNGKSISTLKYARDYEESASLVKRYPHLHLTIQYETIVSHLVLIAVQVWELLRQKSAVHSATRQCKNNLLFKEVKS